MGFREENRNFFVLYNNGDTFYFTVDQNFEIYCTRFKNIYEGTRSQRMPGAHALEFTGNSFSLKSATGETIYSLEEYQQEMSNILPTQEELPEIERLWIDEDVRIGLLATGKIKYDPEASQIPGLLYEPQYEKHSYVRSKRQQHAMQAVNRA